MKLQAFVPSEVVVNPALLARKGTPDKKKVQALAENMLQRREDGRPHQIQPGVVRVNGDGVAECFVGQHRLAAETLLNTQMPEGVDPFEFWAIAVPSNDEQALIDAVEENAWREATTLEDRGYAMHLLEDAGVTQEKIGKHFKLATSTVSDTLRFAKMPAKFRKMVKDGTMTEEAALLAARYNKDAKIQEDIMAVAVQTRTALDAIAERAANHADAEKEAEAEASTEPEEGAEAPEKGKKASTKTAPTSDAVKGKKKAAGGKGATKGKVTAEDVKQAINTLDVKKKKAAGDKKATRTMTNFLTFLEANYGPNVDENVSEAIAEWAGKFEDWRNMKVGDQGLKNAFAKCFKSKL